MIKKISLLIILCSMLGPIYAKSQAQTKLLVKPLTLTVNGKKTQIYSIQQADGTWGYTGTQGEEFNALVENQTSVPITLHWHGLVVPNNQDGVPYVTQEPIAPGAKYPYHFKLMQSGTYWMHSHYKFQMQQGLFAPLILKNPNDPYQNAKEVVMLISDFSFKSPEEINQSLTNPSSMMEAMDMSSMPMSHDHTHHHSTAQADLNDVQYDTFLTNYHSLTEPQLVTVTPGQIVRLRIIDGGSATSFLINLGQLRGKVIAVDGQMIKPVAGSRFSISEGQRLDILIKLPNGFQNAYPILAQAEGTKQQTGLVLTTPSAKIPSLSETVKTTFGAINSLQDLKFNALHPLTKKPANVKLSLGLEGSMSPYVWKINNQVWPHITPIKVKQGDRIEMTITNHTNMAHPIHLHGHVFQVATINGQVLSNGPVRDTVLVPAQGTVSILFDANNSGNWMLHCHMLYHAENGMMTILHYENSPKPKLVSH